MGMRSLVNGTSSFSSGHNQTNWICMDAMSKINCFVDFTHMSHYGREMKNNLCAFGQANVRILLCLQHVAFVIVGPQAWNNKKKGREKPPNILLSAIRLASLSLPRSRSAALYLAYVCLPYFRSLLSFRSCFTLMGEPKKTQTHPTQETFSFFTTSFSLSLSRRLFRWPLFNCIELRLHMRKKKHAHTHTLNTSGAEKRQKKKKPSTATFR